MSTNKQKSYKPENIVFNSDTIILSEKKSSKNSIQDKFYITYNDVDLQAQTSLKIQTGKITMVGFSGIPKLSKDETGFVKSDKDREYIKIPFDDEQEAAKELEKLCKSIDEYMQSKDVKDKITDGKKAEYVPLYKSLEEDDEVDKKYKKYSMMKASFEMNTDKEVRTIRTDFRSTDGNKPDINTVTDAYNALGTKASCRFILSIPYVWKQKIQGKLRYGCKVYINVVQYTASSFYRVSNTEYSFNSDNENDSEEVALPSAKEVKKASKKQIISDSDNEEEDITPTKNLQSEDDEDNDEVPEKKNKKSRIVEDDDDEGEIITARTKKSAKSSSRK